MTQHLSQLKCRKKNTDHFFDPGALVDADAYAPLMSVLAEQGITSFIAKMPLDMALFKKNAVDCIISKYPSIQNWYIGGHSLGGVMAASYAAKHPELIKGIAFLASYPNKDLSDQALKVLSLYGTEDEILNRTSYEEAKALLPNLDLTEIILEGGNHANFGNYGNQKGDGKATLSQEKQQALTVNALLELMISE